MFFYALTCALFTGIFIVRYHVELILFVPGAAGFLTYYLKLGLAEKSPAQNPEELSVTVASCCGRFSPRRCSWL
jgi:decaprenyl-phosphate phosphoribosyltransferase